MAFAAGMPPMLGVAFANARGMLGPPEAEVLGGGGGGEALFVPVFAGAGARGPPLGAALGRAGDVVRSSGRQAARRAAAEDIWADEEALPSVHALKASSVRARPARNGAASGLPAALVGAGDATHEDNGPYDEGTAGGGGSMYAAYRSNDLLRNRAGAAQVPYGAGGAYAAAKATQASAGAGGGGAQVNRVRSAGPGPSARALASKAAAAAAEARAENESYDAAMGMGPFEGGEEGEASVGLDGWQVEVSGDGNHEGLVEEEEEEEEEAMPPPPPRAPARSSGGGPSARRYVPPPSDHDRSGRPHSPSMPVLPEVYETLAISGMTLPVVGPGPEGTGHWVGAYPPAKRTARIARFLQKRGRRMWERVVKYDVRKSFADSRLRVKGRFVKKEDEALLRDFMQLV
jgi:hypothetical protein